MFKIIELEVAGSLGNQTQIDSTAHPPIVKKLYFVFEGWLGDDILEVFPCFIMTEPLKKEIEKEKLTGGIFDNLLVTKSENFIEMYPDKELPQFYWAKIQRSAITGDFSLAADYRLVISEKAYGILSKFNISNALIEELS